MKFWVYFLFSIFYLLFATSIYAQFSLGIFPPLLEINAEPEAEVLATINIENQSENQQELDIVFRPFKLSRLGNGQIELVDEAAIQYPDSLIFEKIKILEQDREIENIILNPLEAKELTLLIDIENNVPLRDYYFSIIFISKNENSLESSNSQVPGGIGTNVILSVGKKGQSRGEIVEFSAPSIVFAGPVPFTLLLRNDGDQYILPTGQVIIKDMFGKEAGRLNLLPEYILSGSNRFMRNSDASRSVPEMFPESRNKPVLVWPQKFLLGLYTAKAHVSLSKDGPVFETEISFLAIPIYFLFGASFLVFVIAGIWLKVKKRT